MYTINGGLTLRLPYDCPMLQKLMILFIHGNKRNNQNDGGIKNGTKRNRRAPTGKHGALRGKRAIISPLSSLVLVKNGVFEKGVKGIDGGLT